MGAAKPLPLALAGGSSLPRRALVHASLATTATVGRRGRHLTGTFCLTGDTMEGIIQCLVFLKAFSVRLCYVFIHSLAETFYYCRLFHSLSSSQPCNVSSPHFLKTTKRLFFFMLHRDCQTEPTKANSTRDPGTMGCRKHPPSIIRTAPCVSENVTGLSNEYGNSEDIILTMFF